MAKTYEKFEEWMIGKTIRGDDGDKGVVTREHDFADHWVWVEWEGIGEAWTEVDSLMFLNVGVKNEPEQENKPIPWEVGQVVWDVVYGKGVVSGVKEDTFPVKVVFDDGGHESYTLQGSFYEAGPRSLFFSEPKIEAELFPPKKPFVTTLKSGDKIVLHDITTDYIAEVVREEEHHIYYKAEDGVVTFVAKRDVKVYKLGEEIKFEEN